MELRGAFHCDPQSRRESISRGLLPVWVTPRRYPGLGSDRAGQVYPGSVPTPLKCLALPRPQHGGRCLSGVAACLMLVITAPEKILPLDTFSSCTQIKVGTKTIIVNEIIGKLWDSEFSGQSYPMSVRKLGILPPTGFR